MKEIAVLLVLWGTPLVTVDRFQSVVECEQAKIAYQEKDKQRASLYRCIVGHELI